LYFFFIFNTYTAIADTKQYDYDVKDEV